IRSKSRFTTLVLLETRESYLQIRVQSQDSRTLSTSSKCHLRSAASLNRPIAFDGGYHSSRLGARNVRLWPQSGLGHFDANAWFDVSVESAGGSSLSNLTHTSRPWSRTTPTHRPPTASSSRWNPPDAP